MSTADCTTPSSMRITGHTDTSPAAVLRSPAAHVDVNWCRVYGAMFHETHTAVPHDCSEQLRARNMSGMM